MDATQAKRDRLLVRTAQIFVAAALLTALFLLHTPGTIGTLAYWVILPFLVVDAVLLIAFPTRAWAGLHAGFVLATYAPAIILAVVAPATPIAAVDFALITLLAAAIPTASTMLLTRRFGRLAFWICAIVTVAVANVTMGPRYPQQFGLWPLIITLLGFLIAYFGGRVLVRSIPDVLGQVRDIGLAHRAERQASEMEANRRQSARLLHDTVLATLTLLAHSGVGVSTEALRSQARNDAHLLRQLRLGEPLFTLPGAPYTPEPVEESTLGTTLESVRERFDGLGLDVAWHGANRIALPQHVLDAFLFSISESLENVRRHAGVTIAHVTVTESERKVSAMITDAGKGFVPDDVSDQRLGIKESVIGRLAEVGGSAKVFSSPGAGTTVLLEVPR